MSPSHRLLSSAFTFTVCLSACIGGGGSGGLSSSEPARDNKDTSPESRSRASTTPSGCVRASDCAADLCECSNGSTVESRDCTNGACLAPSSHCARACTAMGTGWTGRTVERSATPAPAPSEKKDPPASTPVPGPAGTQCVPGTSSSCTYNAEGKWTGELCCVSDAFVCVAGTSSSCTYTAKGKWTGELCCMSSDLQCVAGTSSSCTYTAEGKWTGDLCCVSKALACVPGTSGSCTYTAKGKWTGELCCT